MRHTLLDTLMLKIRTMLTEQATLRIEISQLTSEIKRLEEQQLTWRSQLDTKSNFLDSNTLLSD